jgi:hypothetical protein
MTAIGAKSDVGIITVMPTSASRVQNHVAARLGAPGFAKRQMPGRDVGFEHEIELAQPPARAPFEQMLADAAQLLGHSGRIVCSRSVLHLAERLDVPLRERNVRLATAGYAPVFDYPADPATAEILRHAAAKSPASMPERAMRTPPEGTW